MKAVIMAGGEGSRLRPLTCDIPKPMVRLCGKPIIEYILDLLEKHGFDKAAITVGYLSNIITEHFEEGIYGDVELTFVNEPKPLGTAGGVLNACEENDDCILVISGDAMCDFNLSKAVKEHKEAGADVTIIAKRVSDPREYGIIEVDKEKNITAFLEKPAYTQATSDLANTGVYILSKTALDMIPKEEKYDFASQLFPKMLEEGKKLRVVEDDGYWCDIGDLASYLRCQQDMLAGKVICEIRGQQDRFGNIFADEKPEGDYTMVPPCFIGKNVTIQDGAKIEKSIIDNGCNIMAHARISNSVILQNSKIGERARLTGALIGKKCIVKNDAMLFECATLGSGCILGEQTLVKPYVKVWPEKEIAARTILSEHIKRNVTTRQYFGDDGISGDIGGELTPEFCVKIGAALANEANKHAVAVCCEENNISNVLKQAIICGILSAGTDVYDIGIGTKGMLEYAIPFYQLSLGVYVSSHEKVAIQVLCENGLPSTRKLERAIEGSLLRGDFQYLTEEKFGKKIDMTGVKHLYFTQLQQLAPKGLFGMSCRVDCEDKGNKRFIESFLEQLGVNTQKGPLFQFDADGRKLRITGTEIGAIEYEKLLLMLCIREFKKGNDLSLTFDAPQVIDVVAKQFHRRVYRYFNCPADEKDCEAREKVSSCRFTRDAVMMAVKILQISKSEQKSIAELVENLPTFHIAARDLYIEESPAKLLGEFYKEKKEKEITEGVAVQLRKGFVLLQPEKKGRRIKIMAEAGNMETADEICDGFMERINKVRRKLLDSKQNK